MPNESYIMRTVKGIERKFYRDQRYLVNAETGDIEIYHPIIAAKKGWSEYNPVLDVISTTVKEATPERLAELAEAKVALEQATADLTELQEQFDEVVDIKLRLEKQNAELIMQIQALEATPDPISPADDAAADEPQEPAEEAPVAADPIDAYRIRISDSLGGRNPQALAAVILEEFTTVDALQAATAEDLEDLPGIGPKYAERALEAIAAEASA